MGDAIRSEIKAVAQDFAAEEAFLSKQAAKAAETTAIIVTTKETLSEILADAAPPPGSLARFQKTSKDLKDTEVTLTKTEKDKIEGKKFLPPEQVKEQAEQFERNNPELKSTVLTQLLDEIAKCTTKEEILKIIDKYYPDPTLADQALDYLLATTIGDLHKIVTEAKIAHQALYKKQIDAGRHIEAEVKQYAALGLGSAQSLRDLYRNILNEPREAIQLFLELSQRFQYKDLRKVMAFLFHSLGADLKAGGSMIPPGQLHRLLTETRNLQAGLGVMKFFQARMRLILSIFKKEGIPLPANLTFEELSRTFVTYLQDRYPNSEKVLQLTKKLGLADSILSKIVVLSQFRDGIREVSLDKFYRSIEHRYEVYNSIIEALEVLEDELDELLEEDQDKEDVEPAEDLKIDPLSKPESNKPKGVS